VLGRVSFVGAGHGGSWRCFGKHDEDNGEDPIVIVRRAYKITFTPWAWG